MSYAVIVKSAKMPNSCWGRYCRVGVVELQPGHSASDVTMLSERARAVKRVVATWERQHVGKTARCAAQRAILEAEELVRELSRRPVGA